PSAPVADQSIGMAYHMVPTIRSVDEEGPAAAAGIAAGETITRLELTKVSGSAPDGGSEEPIVIDVDETNWAHAFWQMQEFPARQVQLTVQAAGSDEKRTLEITPQAAADWYLPTTRGIQLFPLASTRKAETIPAAFAMGWDYTKSSMMDIY